MNTPFGPLARTDKANKSFTVFLVIGSLIMLIAGNNIMTKNWQFLGTDLSGALNNIGLAALIAAITQYYTDFKVRAKFYQDISDNILANGSLRDSGILQFYEDSKDCIARNLIKNCRNLDVGVTYSDRFLKDNLSYITKLGDKLELRIFYSDIHDENVLTTISNNLGIDTNVIKNDFAKLTSVISQIEKSGVRVSKFANKHMPHYSFYTIDNQHFFLTISTFASRRSTVPLFQLDRASSMASLIRDDIQHVISQTAGAN